MKIEDLNLSALKYFIDAVELESISESAAKNNVSRPAVSQAILRLEQVIEMTLCVHEKRSFELTADGKDFYQKAKASLKQFETTLLFTERPDSSVLNIGCSASLIDLIFPKIKSHLKQARGPTIKIGPTHQLIDYLRDGSINLAFLVSVDKSHPFKAYNFRSGNFQIFSKSGKLGAHLITTENRPEVESFQKYATKSKIQFISQIKVESWSIAIKLAQMDLGCCLVPDFINPTGLIKVESRGWHASYLAQILIRKYNELSPIEEKILDSMSKNS